jgi:hypothetical protein
MFFGKARTAGCWRNEVVFFEGKRKKLSAPLIKYIVILCRALVADFYF